MQIGFTHQLLLRNVKMQVPVVHRHFSGLQPTRCLISRPSLRCRAELLPSDGSVSNLAKEAMLARLKKAREYKQAAQGAPSEPSPPTQPGPAAAAPAAASADTNPLQQLAQYAERQAEAEAQAFLQAQAAAASAPASPPPPPITSAGPVLRTLPPPSSLAERIRRENVYADLRPGSDAETPPPAAAAEVEVEPPARSGDSTNDSNGPDDSDRDFRRGSGSADQAANWLQTISGQGRASQVDTSQRPEVITAQLEALQRQKGATIERAKGVVTGSRRRFDEDGYGLAQQQDEAQASMAADRADVAAARLAEQAAAAGGVEAEKKTEKEEEEEEEEAQHKPAVATWGVFPRPKNISQAYGGGRNLRPGQQLESAEAEVARKQRISQALTSYKQAVGLDLDPLLEQQSDALYKEGEILFKAGAISAALDKFSAATDLVPLRSRPGGLATLQKAICLDSLGRNEEAFKLYKKLEGHSAPGVAKTTKRMLFGFQAARQLKVDTMSFGSGDSKAWEPWFDRINSDGWTVYKPKDGEDEDEGAAVAAAVAAAVVLLPLAFAAALVLK